jgi:hypothetical protein
MKIILQKASKAFKPVVLQTTPLNFLQTIDKANFKEGHPKFDSSIYNLVTKSIRNNKPVVPITLFVTENGIPTQLDKAQGLYAAVAAKDLGISLIPVYVYVVDVRGHVIAKPTLIQYPKGFETPKLKPDITKWSDYAWYRLKPMSKKPILITDIKGQKFYLDPGTVYGAYTVKTGVRIVDADDTKVFFIVKPQRVLKLIDQSVKLRKPPLIIDMPRPASLDKLVTTVDSSLEHQDPEQEEKTDTSERIIDIEYLQSYNDIDDLSKELYGHHLQEFDEGGYEDLDSLSAGQVMYIQPNPIVNTGGKEASSFGRVYARFFETNSIAAQAKEDSRIAEENMIKIIQDLFNYLVSLNMSNVSVLSGFVFNKPLKVCSASIEKWKMLNKSNDIKHLVIAVNGIILDPCFKRLGITVRTDVYPISEFQRLWKNIETIAIGSTVDSVQSSKLFTAPASELQIPLPSFNRSREYSESRTKIKLTA